MKVQSHKDLIVWQKSMDLVVAVYAMTSTFPPSELYGLTSQMRRSAVSIPSNIAEGRRRVSAKEYRQFLAIALGSASELETQYEIAVRLGFGNVADCKHVEILLNEVLRMLVKMTATLRVV